MNWRRFARQPAIQVEPRGPFASLKIALVSDDLTSQALAHECVIKNVTPRNHRSVLGRWAPDLLLVETSWRGHNDAWRYRVASYPDHPRRSNASLAKVVAFARERGIPALFWNREDGVHFDRFIASAKLFDRVLTVDETMLPRYREELGPDAKIGTMMFAASDALHYPTFEEPRRRAVFVGSYSKHIHDGRRLWQDAMFAAAQPLGLDVYDRNSARKADHYRYPAHPWLDVKAAVPHGATPDLYRRHAVNLNVNTITGSATAFSRRLVETLACGGFVLSNRTKAIDTHFGDYCIATDDAGEARVLFEQVAPDGLSSAQEAQRRAAADHVHRHHSWQQRIPQLLEMANG